MFHGIDEKISQLHDVCLFPTCLNNDSVSLQAFAHFRGAEKKSIGLISMKVSAARTEYQVVLKLIGWMQTLKNNEKLCS
jgi:hypothetical protein